MDPLSLIGAGASVLGGLFGRRDAAEQMKQQWDMALWRAQADRNVAGRAYKRDIRTMKLANKMNRANTREAQDFQRIEAGKAALRTDRAAIRNRKWAMTDRKLEAEDQLNQFVRLREAANKAGLNPLSVIGADMVPSPAGGLSTGSYAAAAGVGVAPVNAFASSTPMGAGGYTPVLASNDAIIGGIQEFGREISGQAALERSNLALNNEIARIELERARAGMARPVVPPAAQLGGAGLGRQAQRAGNVATGVPSLGDLDDWFPQGQPVSQRSITDTHNPREVNLKPTDNIDPMGVFDSDLIRALTGGFPVYYPTVDGEPAGGAAAVWGIGVPGAVLRRRVVDPINSAIRDTWDGFVRGSAERSFTPSLGVTFDENNPFGGGQFQPNYVNPLY